jgi:predicted GNAT family acetyltransferase
VTLRTHFYDDPRQHLARVQAFLVRDPVFNMHQLRIASRAASQRESGEEIPDVLWGVIVEREGEVVASALYTTRKALLVSPHEPDATAALVGAIPPDTPIPDVVGKSESVWRIARALDDYELFIEGSLYALESAPQMPNTRVHFLQADLSHLQLVVDWNHAFIRELELKDPVSEVAKHARYRVERGQYFLAFDGDTPVAMAGGTYVGDGIGSIGPVYTLPSYRTQGLKLGQSVTAYASTVLRTAGARCVVLMADQRNPVSNAAYQKIGFTNRGEFHHLQESSQPTRK